MMMDFQPRFHVGLLFCLALATPTFTDASGQTSSTAASGPCSKFQPGMQFLVTDDNTRNVDGLSSLTDNLSQDVHNFNGVLYQIAWGMIEGSPGSYDWSRLDQAFALAKSAGKYFRVRVEDRTFWTGCGSNFIPADISREVSVWDTGTCFATIWNQPTMDRYIALLTALIQRYGNDPFFLGVTTEESVLDSITLRANPALVVTALYPQLQRLAGAVHNANANALFIQHINWPYNGNNLYLMPMINKMISYGSGMGIGWPDSMVDNEYNWSWYQFARAHYDQLVIAPSADAGTVSTATDIPTALADHEKTYQMLVNDLHASMIVWNTWNEAFGDAYFTDVIIPTVNKHNGAVLNTSCPFIP
jgi:hypothetical protein